MRFLLGGVKPTQMAKNKMSKAVAWLAAFFLYGFCGAGVYWNFLSWFHHAELASLAGVIVPFVLIWLVWAAWQNGTLC
jgi:hypothetical protein